MTTSPRRAAPKHAPRPPRVPFALLVLGLLAGGMCTLLALNTAAAANEVQRHDVAAQDEGIAAQLVQLRNQLQDSAAPANLAAAARALGMVPAGNPAFLQIGPDGTVRVLGHPAPATAAPVYLPPTKSPRPKPKPTSKTTARNTAKPTGKATDKSTSTTKPTTARSATKSATRTPTPTPTPTPESTLPGGTR